MSEMYKDHEVEVKTEEQNGTEQPKTEQKPQASANTIWTGLISFGKKIALPAAAFGLGILVKTMLDGGSDDDDYYDDTSVTTDSDENN